MSELKPTVDVPNHADVAVLVVSWDGYQDVWKPFFHCFFKYWPDCPYPIFLGSNSRNYPDSRISPILIGTDIDYSSNLTAMLSHIDQDWVIIWIEDALLSARVDTTRVCNLIALSQREEVGFLRLFVDPFNVMNLAIKKEMGQEIVELPKHSQYRLSINFGLWKKSVLLKLLRPGETAWDIERKGTNRSIAMEDKFFCVARNYMDDPLFSFTHGIRKRKWTRDAVRFLREEGMKDCLRTRPSESRWSHIYITIYTRLRYLYFKNINRKNASDM